ncbi:MAG: DUF6465 family protein [Clostridiales bacterium]|jgi:hypothetical protein|nr:DUF6465 family protein [Clostridiales bacterium]
MKIEYYVELVGEQTEMKRLSDIVKEIWKGEGNLVKDLVSMEIYFKPEEKMCYYVINRDVKGKFQV